jgi:hypothetical protein
LGSRGLFPGLQEGAKGGIQRRQKDRVTADPARHGLVYLLTFPNSLTRCPLFLAEGYSALGQVVGGHFYHNFVAWQDPNEVETHFS